MCALCAALMFVGKLISIADYAVCCICSLVIGVVVIEAGWKWAIASYVVTSILGVFIGGNECALLFVVYAGYYPILKPYIEKLPIVPEWIIKLVSFNGIILLSYWLLDLIGILKFDEVDFLGSYTVIVLMVLGNIVFILFDILFNKLMTIYYFRYHSRIAKMLK